MRAVSIFGNELQHATEEVLACFAARKKNEKKTEKRGRRRRGRRRKRKTKKEDEEGRGRGRRLLRALCHIIELTEPLPLKSNYILKAENVP